ncbi:MAG TPA: HD domain-containing phosphohydrolase [Solirubrobacteraceae bacterium]|jgi:HD-GYP domain-containing protein (c-di-GMP phosphodiesterase class II)/methylmalonyl-CoA mutase cobalamin-binding subunit|nr:HD domain-containing phosphohydrolase [Solirubrobacteraceae bacterium]
MRAGGAVPDPSGGEDRQPRGPRSPLHAIVPLALCAGAVAVLLAEGVSTLAAVAAGALALSAAALGFHLGDRGRAALEEEVEGRTSELKRALSELEIAQAETVRRLSMAVEFRDEDTGAHIERIGRFSTLLAEHIGMDAEFCERLRHAAPLHDVGKVAIPDAILLKPGPLTPEERAIVETHAEEGHRLVRGSSSSILDMAATIALSHQEKWDGSGYPRGLKGEAIPIEGRIVAVADVFDALTSDRVYRKAFSIEEAVQMMREQRGRHFDPILLDAFMEVLGQTGPDAREQLQDDPVALVESTLETFAGALERGDAETAESAIASAIEDGIAPTTLHAEVIGPALRRISVLAGAGEIDTEREHRASTITRRVLATLYRYMTVGTEPTRERVLLAGVAGDDHTLGLQMVHDQLAAAGFRTTFDTGLAPDRLLELVEGQSPDLVVVGATAPGGAEEIEDVLRELHSARPDMPIVLSGPAVGGGLPRDREGMRVLERIDETVQAVEGVLGSSAPAASV